MISVSKLEKSLGARTLFQNVTFLVNPGERLGVVGANGAGKSMLLRMIAGEEPMTDGVVTRAKNAALGYLRQDHFLASDKSVLELAMMGQKEAFAALAERDRLLALPHVDSDALVAVEEVIGQYDGYTLPARAAGILSGLGMSDDKQHESMSKLSGGFRWRVLLAQVLVAKPDVLLLDEPTNHLDIISIRWLEKFLTNYDGAIILVSHDRRFLDNVCTMIADIDFGTITVYRGNYTRFEQQKALSLTQLEAERANKTREKEHMQAYVDRFRAKASKARQAQSRLKQMERIEIVDPPKTTRQKPRWKFEQVRPSGREVATIKHLSKSYHGVSVLSDVNFLIFRGEKVGVIGPNGVGKSTLLKLIVDEIPADSGKIKLGFEVSFGYLTQDLEKNTKHSDASVEEWLWQHCPGESRGFVRSLLGRVLFSGTEAEKPVATLSGGEVVRLTMAYLMYLKPNVLVLDEPTNHLDIEAAESLVEALKAYPGTLLFVSHDRWFVEQLATRILEIKPTGLRDFPGSYAEYIADCGDDHLDAAVAKRLAKADKETGVSDNKQNFASNKEDKARLRKLTSERDNLLRQIESREGELASLSACFCMENFYRDTSPEDIKKMQQDQARLQREISELTAKWEAVEAQLSA